MTYTRGERTFQVFNSILISILSATMVLPFIHILALSLSDNTAVLAGKVTFLPIDFTLNSYAFVLANEQFFMSFGVSVIVTLLGTVMAVMLTLLTAYPLSKPNLKGRNAILIYFIITMLFNGGLIPTFLLIRALGLYDTIGALIIPGLFAAYNMLLAKNYIETIPESLEEAALIDGAGPLQIFTRILLPLITPMTATIGLFYAVGYWNAYFPGIMYTTSPEVKPLQTYLYEIVRLSTVPIHELDIDLAMSISPRSVQSATVFAATLPILLVYPFLQKYFVKGLVIGSVKG